MLANSFLLAEIFSDTGARHMLAALLYSLVGIALFGLVWLLIAKLAPFSLRKEIEEDQNTALAIILAAVILGIALIISAAIQG